MTEILDKSAQTVTNAFPPKRTEATEISPDNAEQLLAGTLDDVVPKSGHHTTPVIGLGGSAGSLKPLQEFFTKIPPDAGLVYVVVVHLSPEHESLLPEILQKCTTMPVMQVQNSVRVNLNHVYVIPPAKHLAMMDGHIILSDIEKERGRRVAVDLFFRTLADSHGPRAIALVLSGSDSDGSIGIKRVKERGGLTIVQNPDEAEHAGMPRSALETGMIDWVLNVGEIPDRLLAFARNGARLTIAQAAEEKTSRNNGDASSTEIALLDILAVLRNRTSRDFTAYKRATVLRRIARRMQVNGVDTLTEYLGFLRTHAGESGALLQDLLISVTNFFRDRDAFTALEKIIPDLFKGKTQDDVVRVWVCACATGEEAYSLAMLLNEYALTLDAPPQIQIFATDIDEDAIAAARAGNYTEAIIADVSEERLRAFFFRQHGRYRVNQSLRERVLFAVHDLLKDAPFSRIDLVTCRNLLIYLNRDAQVHAFDIFHFALRPEGGLFLGTSETAEDASPLFSVVDKKHRVYRRRDVERAGMPVQPGSNTVPMAIQAIQRFAEKIAHTVDAHTSTHLLPPLAESKEIAPADLHLKLIEGLSPPSLVIDQNATLIHLSASVGRYLQISGGAPSSDLVQLIHPALRVDLRTAVFRAVQSRTPVTVRNLIIEIDGAQRSVDISVRPSPELAPDYFLIVFNEHLPSEALIPAPQGSLLCEDVAHHLERELELTKQQLRATLEQHSASAEEMKASNEELQAMNEELRSASEELETSREELQSINEELSTVNSELKSKVDEVGRANSDLQNLMGAMSIAIVFLDAGLRIKRYTPSSVALFNFIPTDIGRPLSDLNHRLEYATIEDDAGKVLADLIHIEREVRSSDGTWYMARFSPYRTVDNKIAGVVLTFVDITDRRKAEELVRESEARFRAIVSQNAAGICRIDLSGQIIFANEKFCALLGWSKKELLQKKFWSLLETSEQETGLLQFDNVRDTGAPFELEKKFLRRDGSVIWASMNIALIRDADQKPQSTVALIVDTTERRKTEGALRISEEKYRTLFEAMSQGFAIYEVVFDETETPINLMRVEANPASLAILSPYSGDDPASESEIRSALLPSLAESAEVVQTSRALHRESHCATSGRWFDVRTFALHGVDKHRIGVLFTEITDRKRAEQELRITGGNLELRVIARTNELDAANKSLRQEIADRVAAEADRQRMMQHLVTAQEDERGRISRELHDEVGQHLTGLMLGLKSLENDRNNDAPRLLGNLQDITEKIGKEIHDLAIELRPTSLDDLGLLRTLTNYFHDWSGRTKIAIEFHRAAWPDARLPSHIETTFYRVICEALNNVLKHAQATRVSIILEHRGQQAVAIIEDNGRGFDSGDASPPSQKALGLVGMRERAVLVDGEVTIESNPGKGTTVFVRIPLNSDATKHS